MSCLANIHSLFQIEWNGTYANKDLSRFKTRDDFSLLVTLPDVEGEITVSEKYRLCRHVIANDVMDE